jgi:hypothetical protein
MRQKAYIPRSRLKGPFSFPGVEVEEGLEIGAGVELILQAELFDQLEVVVDLAVADDRGAGGVQRLPAALQVDDRQARVCQRGLAYLLDADPV